jgi:signal transduction histidine kinase
MRLRTVSRITIPIAAVSLLLLVVGASGAWYVHTLQRRSSQILTVNVASIIAAEELELQLREIRFELHQFLITQDPAHLSAAVQRKDEVERQRKIAEGVAVTPREQHLMREIKAGLGRLLGSLELLLADPQSSPTSAQVARVSDEILTHGVLEASREYLKLNAADLSKSNSFNQRMSERLAIALLLLGTCGAVSGLVAGYGAARGINRSILQLSVPIRDVAGKLNEVVGPVSVSADPGLEDLESVLRTVTDEVESIIQKLHVSQREIIRADQLAAVGQLAAGLAHELRNPLMCIKVLVQSARRTAARRLEGRDLEVLEEEITRLEDRLEGFLNFARPPKLQVSRLDLRQLVTQTIHLLSHRASRRGIRIIQHAPEPLQIDADEGQIRQVLLNILLNALDAVTNQGTIEVRLWPDDGSVRMSGPTQSGAVLEVLDDGHGLPKENSGRIFEPFFSTKDTGLGLGLAISRRIVESHGGELTAADRPEGGAVFSVWLPDAARNADDALPRQAHASSWN